MVIDEKNVGLRPDRYAEEDSSITTRQSPAWESDMSIAAPPLTIYDAVEDAGKNLYIKALTDIPQDVRAGLKRGHSAEQTAGNKTASKVMLTVLENKLAERGLDMVEVKRRLKIGAERATKEYPLRSNSVHPLTRKNTQTNTGQGLPIIKVDFVPDSDKIELWMAPKGSGSENMSFLRMLKPADGIKAVKRFVIECVFESGANPCPPVIVGIGIGGTSDAAAAMAKEASCFRLVGSESPDSQVATLEKELLELINQTGIGPQGLGGQTTAMAVNIEWAHTHISQLPVAVNMQCWRGERACAMIDGEGNVTYPD
jgi:fumarate hydratase subunit alpha/L(+)-tartrate dehydratase alpha subunit